MNYETRTLLKQLELRDADKSKHPKSIGTLDGRVANWNVRSVDFGGFFEELAPNCFSRSLKMKDDRHDVRALYAHDKTRVLGRSSAGTLECGEDELGLWMRAHLIDTTDGRDAIKNVEAGNLNAMSFGFLPMEKPIWKRDGADMIRRVEHAHLFEVSIVAWAQYPETELAVRELNEFKAGQPVVKTGMPLRLLRQRHAFHSLT